MNKRHKEKALERAQKRFTQNLEAWDTACQEYLDAMWFAAEHKKEIPEDYLEQQKLLDKWAQDYAAVYPRPLPPMIMQYAGVLQ